MLLIIGFIAASSQVAYQLAKACWFWDKRPKAVTPGVFWDISTYVVGNAICAAPSVFVLLAITRALGWV